MGSETLYAFYHKILKNPLIAKIFLKCRGEEQLAQDSTAVRIGYITAAEVGWPHAGPC